MTSSPPLPHGHDVHRTAVETLARRITDGAYDVGRRLRPPVLAAELGFVEPVLGEAVRVLAAKGVVDAGHRVLPRAEWNVLDADVLRWTLTEAHEPLGSFDVFPDLHELRRAVEPSAAALAAQFRSPEDLSALGASLSAMAEAERLDRAPHAELAARADATFHTTLLTASGNRFFARLAHVLAPPLTARSERVHAGPHHHPLPTHTEVAARVRDRDADGAYTAMLELLDLSLRDDPTP
ncbi:FadR/GntR family transcriptional regulator [Streptomyces sp. NPDC016845]|uniref:FadR/GntR family transcriptional regulator n=1 Tax=Streptomyces sp. NPDC016845 TaxID=3364972 RepID=UPI0037B82319